MAMVLKLIDAQGQPIKGESKVKGHEGEIDVLAWSWGLSEAAGKVTLQDLSIRKSVDLASVPILRVAETSEHLLRRRGPKEKNWIFSSSRWIPA
jgi:type VI protein secretion system component Hcp